MARRVEHDGPPNTSAGKRPAQVSRPSAPGRRDEGPLAHAASEGSGARRRTKRGTAADRARYDATTERLTALIDRLREDRDSLPNGV